MERLTRKHYGAADYYMGCSETCANDDEMCGGCPWLEKIINRLGAYEDTGLSPEKLEDYKILCEMYAQAGLDAKFVQACIDAVQAGLTVKRLHELLEAEKDGRLVVLPCKDVTVYTIKENYFNCDTCVHKSEARYDPLIQRMSCSRTDYHCPFYIMEHTVGGFMISFAEGKPILSAPGEWGYEGLEPFSGIDGKWHLTREAAEAAREAGVYTGTEHVPRD